jgi:hypothetical protein
LWVSGSTVYGLLRYRYFSLYHRCLEHLQGALEMKCPACKKELKYERVNLCALSENCATIGWFCEFCEKGGIANYSGHVYVVGDDGEIYD